MIYPVTEKENNRHESPLIRDALSKMSNTKTERLSEIEELMYDNLFRNDANAFRMDGYRDITTEYDPDGA